MRLETKLVRGSGGAADPYRATAAPLYQTATFAQPAADEAGPYDYTRSGNPTRTVLEESLALLEGGARALAFTSGMAAVANVLRLVRSGERVLAGCDGYGGTFRFLTKCLPRQGVAVDFVDTTDLFAVRDALRPQTRLVLVETPTNPLMRIADVAGIAGLAARAGALFAVDNTMLSPLLQRPLELGADLVIHSATRHLGGHGDLTAGVVVAGDAALAEELDFFRNAEGNALAPFEAWLLLRGLQTLGVRIERQERSAQRLARFLAARPDVRRVHYAGLMDHPGHALHATQARGAGSLISFETGSRAMSKAVVERLQLFSIAVSFGNVKSLASLPCAMSHASIPEEVRRERALPEDLVRLSIGLEDADDLTEDLGLALEYAARGGGESGYTGRRSVEWANDTSE